MTHARTLLELYHRLGIVESRAGTETGPETKLRDINNSGDINHDVDTANNGRGVNNDVNIDNDGDIIDRTTTELGTEAEVGVEGRSEYGWEPLTRRSTLHMLTVTLKLIRDRTLAGDIPPIQHITPTTTTTTTTRGSTILVPSTTTATATATTTTSTTRTTYDNPSTTTTSTTIYDDPTTTQWNDLLLFAKEIKASRKGTTNKSDHPGGVEKRTKDDAIARWSGRSGSDPSQSQYPPMSEPLSLSEPLPSLTCEDVLVFLMNTGAQWQSLPTRPRNHLSDALADALVVVPHTLSTTHALVSQVPSPFPFSPLVTHIIITPLYPLLPTNQPTNQLIN